MFMSLNSLESKISPHSLHSTNSDSSSRLTICTRGCLQGCFMFFAFSREGVGFEVINPEGPRRRGRFSRNFWYFRPGLRLVKPQPVTLSRIFYDFRPNPSFWFRQNTTVFVAYS